MSLHRLLGFRAAVADPTALAPTTQSWASPATPARATPAPTAAPSSVVDEAPFRRLISVDIGCHDDRDLDAVQHDSKPAAPLPHASRSPSPCSMPHRACEFTVRVAEPEAAGAARRVSSRRMPRVRLCGSTSAPPACSARRGPRAGSAISSSAPRTSRATRDLLVDGIGCKVSDEFDGIIHFLRCSTDHHNIGLVHSPVPILQHYSWECDDLDHVGYTATALYRSDPGRHTWGIGRHFAGSNFYWYLRDPAGSFLELYSDLDRIDRRRRVGAARRTPMSLEHSSTPGDPTCRPNSSCPTTWPSSKPAGPASAREPPTSLTKPAARKGRATDGVERQGGARHRRVAGHRGRGRERGRGQGRGGRAHRTNRGDLEAVLGRSVVEARQPPPTSPTLWRSPRRSQPLEAELGPVDVLIANAGIGAYGPFADIEADEMERLVKVNVLGTMYAIRACYPA